jgi:hypothetical protein
VSHANRIAIPQLCLSKHGQQMCVLLRITDGQIAGLPQDVDVPRCATGPKPQLLLACEQTRDQDRRGLPL